MRDRRWPQGQSWQKKCLDLGFQRCSWPREGLWRLQFRRRSRTFHWQSWTWWGQRVQGHLGLGCRCSKTWKLHELSPTQPLGWNWKKSFKLSPLSKGILAQAIIHKNFRHHFMAQFFMLLYMDPEWLLKVIHEWLLGLTFISKLIPHAKKLKNCAHKLCLNCWSICVLKIDRFENRLHRKPDLGMKQ